VTVVAGAGRDIGKGRVVVGIDVTDGERAAGGGDIAQVALADRPTERAGNHGSIIGAGDGNRHLLGGAIAGGKGIGVLHHVAGVEVLDRALAAGNGPALPGARPISVTVVAGAGRDIGKGRVVVGIDVTDGERAAGGGDIAQ